MGSCGKCGGWNYRSLSVRCNRARAQCHRRAEYHGCRTRLRGRQSGCNQVRLTQDVDYHHSPDGRLYATRGLRDTCWAVIDYHPGFEPKMKPSWRSRTPQPRKDASWRHAPRTRIVLKPNGCSTSGPPLPPWTFSCTHVVVMAGASNPSLRDSVGSFPLAHRLQWSRCKLLLETDKYIFVHVPRSSLIWTCEEQPDHVLFWQFFDRSYPAQILSLSRIGNAGTSEPEVWN